MRRSADFGAVLRRGRRAGRPTLVLHLLIGGPSDQPLPDGGADQPVRIGFVVSRAVGNAVTRNRVRRRLRVVSRERLATLPAGSSLVVRALPAAVGASSARLRTDVDAALRRVLASGPYRPAGRVAERRPG